ncbi:MAG: hypothetical protein HOM96_02005 [Rickettsiales bacterium]|mgnify:FL=1|jgi:fructose-1,6-bisphosphatase/inositol monophosphatase family enzyme|nr:hypothetical protein [Rickettsiales bacterium]
MGYAGREPAIIITLNKILGKIQHKIIRDFYEIEFLQKSQFFPQKFVHNLTETTHSFLIDNLLTHYPNNGLILNGETINDVTSDGTVATDYFIVDSLADQANLSRSLPFIANSVTLIKDFYEKTQIIATVINYPILDITLNSHKDTEVFCNQKRIQITANTNSEPLAIISNIASENSEFYNFNSLAYEALLIFQNKADILIKSYKDSHQLYAFEFIARKANFICSVDEEKQIFKISNNKSIANT